MNQRLSLKFSVSTDPNKPDSPRAFIVAQVGEDGVVSNECRSLGEVDGEIAFLKKELDVISREARERFKRK